MTLALHEPVVALMRQVARDVVMPRFRNLAAHIEAGILAPTELILAKDG